MAANELPSNDHKPLTPRQRIVLLVLIAGVLIWVWNADWSYWGALID